MKRIIALILALACVLSLTACSGSVNTIFYDEGKDKETYEKNGYTQITDISGVSFVCPDEIMDKVESFEAISKYKPDELGSHIFKNADDEDYCLYSPGSFFLYVFTLKNADGIEEKHDVADLPALIGASKWISLESRNPNTYTSKNIDGNVQAIYGAYLTESMTGKDVTYKAYVTILHNDETDKDYAFIVGFNEIFSDEVAKGIAENFKLVK